MCKIIIQIFTKTSMLEKFILCHCFFACKGNKEIEFKYQANNNNNNNNATENEKTLNPSSFK